MGEHQTEYFVPFPEPESVFTGDMKKHAELFLPLCNVDLGYFNSAWKGFCPIVTTVEPCDGGVFGTEKPAHHTYYCRDNWIGYKLADSKLTYLGDWELFSNNENQSYYKAVFEGYERAKVHFNKIGHLGPYEFKDGYDNWEAEELAVELAWVGGESSEGNWVSTTNFPVKMAGSEVFPLTEDGRSFEYLCSIEVSSFIYGDGEAKWAMGCSLIAFIDAQQQILLTTFEWT